MYLFFKPVEEGKRYIFIYFSISLLEARKKKREGERIRKIQ